MSTTLISRNVSVAGHRTSLRLEPPMWEALEEICIREGRNLHQVCTDVDRRRRQSSLTAAVRVFILGYFRAAATEAGHARAGHGGAAPEVAQARFGLMAPEHTFREGPVRQRAKRARAFAS